MKPSCALADQKTIMHRPPLREDQQACSPQIEESGTHGLGLYWRPRRAAVANGQDPPSSGRRGREIGEPRSWIHPGEVIFAERPTLVFRQEEVTTPWVPPAEGERALLSSFRRLSEEKQREVLALHHESGSQLSGEELLRSFLKNYVEAEGSSSSAEITEGENNFKIAPVKELSARIASAWNCSSLLVPARVRQLEVKVPVPPDAAPHKSEGSGESTSCEGSSSSTTATAATRRAWIRCKGTDQQEEEEQNLVMLPTPLYPRMNHSCRPNAAYRLVLEDVVDGARVKQEGGGDGDKRHHVDFHLGAENENEVELLLEVVALSPIKPGDEICTCYQTRIERLNREDRAEILFKERGIANCRCRLCACPDEKWVGEAHTRKLRVNCWLAMKDVLLEEEGGCCGRGDQHGGGGVVEKGELEDGEIIGHQTTTTEVDAEQDKSSRCGEGAGVAAVDGVNEEDTCTRKGGAPTTTTRTPPPPVTSLLNTAESLWEAMVDEQIMYADGMEVVEFVLEKGWGYKLLLSCNGMRSTPDAEKSKAGSLLLSDPIQKKDGEVSASCGRNQEAYNALPPHAPEMRGPECGVPDTEVFQTWLMRGFWCEFLRTGRFFPPTVFGSLVEKDAEDTGESRRRLHQQLSNKPPMPERLRPFLAPDKVSWQDCSSPRIDGSDLLLEMFALAHSKPRYLEVPAAAGDELEVENVVFPPGKRHKGSSLNCPKQDIEVDPGAASLSGAPDVSSSIGKSSELSS